MKMQFFSDILHMKTIKQQFFFKNNMGSLKLLK